MSPSLLFVFGEVELMCRTRMLHDSVRNRTQARGWGLIV